MTALKQALAPQHPSTVSVVLVMNRQQVWPKPLMDSLLGQIHKALDLWMIIPDHIRNSEAFATFCGKWCSNSRRTLEARSIPDEHITFELEWQKLQGNYVFFPNLDSELDPEFHSTLVSEMDSTPSLDMIHTNGILVNEHDPTFALAPIFTKSQLEVQDAYWSSLLRKCNSDMGNALVRKTFAKMHGPNDLSLEPVSLHRRLILTLYRHAELGILDQPLLKYILSHKPLEPLSASHSFRLEEESHLHEATTQVLADLNADHPDISRDEFLAELTHFRAELVLEERFRVNLAVEPLVERTLTLIQSYLIDSAHYYSAEHFSFSSPAQVISFLDLVLESAFQDPSMSAFDRLLGLGSEIFESSENTPQFYLHGAGAAGLEVLKVMQGFGFTPNKVWDNQNDLELALNGLPVTQPQPEIMKASWAEAVLIIAVKDIQTAQHIANGYKLCEKMSIIHIPDQFVARSYFLEKRMVALQVGEEVAHD